MTESVGIVVFWCSGAVVQWCSGAVVQWCSGAVMQWCSGALAKASDFQLTEPEFKNKMAVRAVSTLNKFIQLALV